MSNKILLIGGGGHCHSVIDTILSLNTYTDIGIIDNISNSYHGISTIGSDNDLPRLLADGWTNAFITVGSIGDTSIRTRLYSIIKDLGFTVPILIDPTAIIASDANIKNGAFIGKRAIVNAGTSIAECSIINSGAVIEHDCKIGAFTHISPGAILCGDVLVGSHTHIGAGSTIRQQISIGSNDLIGIGSVVTKDIPDNVTAYGNPCKIVR